MSAARSCPGCIHCDLCVEACPTEAITETKLFEFSFTNRRDAVYTKDELIVDDDGKAKHMPWEDWRPGEDEHTSGWMRATSPGGDADFVGKVGWSSELGYGVRDARGERAVMQLFVFIVAGLMILGGAVGVVIRSHPVHAALSLILTLFGVAVMYVAQEAHFLAAVQVIVYAGAIVVLFLFVIMLLGVDKAEDLQIEPFKMQRKVAALVGGGVIGLVVFAAISSRDNIGLVKPPQSRCPSRWSTRSTRQQHPQLARDLFSDHVLAFELTSVLLVIAVVGTVLLARRGPKGTVGDTDMIAAAAPTTTWYLVLAAVLFGIGTVGVLVRRNPLIMLMCVELMLNAVNLSFVALSQKLDDIGGQTTRVLRAGRRRRRGRGRPRHHRRDPASQAQRHSRRSRGIEGLRPCSTSSG